jgi:hypothetical protein
MSMPLLLPLYPMSCPASGSSSEPLSKPPDHTLFLPHFPVPPALEHHTVDLGLTSHLNLPPSPSASPPLTPLTRGSKLTVRYAAKPHPSFPVSLLFSYERCDGDSTDLIIAFLQMDVDDTIRQDLSLFHVSSIAIEKNAVYCKFISFVSSNHVHETYSSCLSLFPPPRFQNVQILSLTIILRVSPG